MPFRSRSVQVAIAAAGCAAALGGCGSSHKSNTSASSVGNGLKFAQCMRSHGVTSFPDPNAGGSGFQFNLPGLNPRSPAFQGAQQACRHFVPGPASNPHPSAQAKLGMLVFAKCLRSHGLTNIPDPTSTPHTPGPGIGEVIGRGGVFLVLPTGTAQSPGFQQAVRACGLAPNGRPSASVGPDRAP